MYQKYLNYGEEDDDWEGGVKGKGKKRCMWVVLKIWCWCLQLIETAVFCECIFCCKIWSAYLLLLPLIVTLKSLLYFLAPGNACIKKKTFSFFFNSLCLHFKTWSRDTNTFLFLKRVILIIARCQKILDEENPHVYTDGPKQQNKTERANKQKVKDKDEKKKIKEDLKKIRVDWNR